METLNRLLVENSLFRGLEPDHVAVIAGCASNAVFNEGDVVFRENEPADRFYVIRHGRVALEVSNADGGNIILQTLGADDVLGWSWLVPPHQWRFSARCMTRVRAFAFDGACLRTKCREDTALGFALLERFAVLLEQRLQATRLQVIDMYRSRI